MPMISYPKALAILRSHARPSQEAVTVRLENAIGETLAEDVIADIANPRFRNSAMDGYALVAADTRDASPEHPMRFTVVGSIAAGHKPIVPGAATEVRALEIMTGANVPDGFDTVVRIEDVTPVNAGGSGTDQIEVRRSLKPQENIRLVGEDFQAGQVLLRRGTRIAPQHVMAAACNGRETVVVKPQPRVALLATGRELIAPGGSPAADLPPGKIFSSTQPLLKVAAEQIGAAADSYGIVPDETDAFSSVMKTMLASEPDIVVTTGAVSMGRYDFIPAALGELGAEVLFHKAKIRPGKPILFATLLLRSGKRVAFFGLPGNPIGSAVGFRFFVQPYIAAMLERENESFLRAALSNEIRKPELFRSFLFGTITMGSTGPVIAVPPQQRSFMMTPYLAANAWAIVPEGKERLAVGEAIEWCWL